MKKKILKNSSIYFSIYGMLIFAFFKARKTISDVTTLYAGDEPYVSLVKYNGEMLPLYERIVEDDFGNYSDYKTFIWYYNGKVFFNQNKGLVFNAKKRLGELLYYIPASRSNEVYLRNNLLKEDYKIIKEKK